MSLEYYLNKFSHLNMNRTNGIKSPHKICMLLTIIDLIQTGVIRSNRIEFNYPLKQRFSELFIQFARNNDKDTPENPYFHLRSEGFWHIEYRDGYNESNTKRYSTKAISHAFLDDELFKLIKSPIVVNELRDALASNITNFSDLFYQWLIDIGKSDKTAKNYSGAVKGSISNWLMDDGCITEPLTEIGSYSLISNYKTIAQGLDIFKRKDTKGRGMYSAALTHYQNFLADLTQIDTSADIRQIMTSPQLTETEKAILTSTRMGQGSFRTKLINLWQGCALTGYKNTSLLLASHIKPWRDSNNQERLDEYNGLLLLANIDKAFDLGFISFKDNGMIMISKYLEEPEILGINEDMSFAIKPANKPYLGYHRDLLFKGF